MKQGWERDIPWEGLAGVSGGARMSARPSDLPGRIKVNHIKSCLSSLKFKVFKAMLG